MKKIKANVPSTTPPAWAIMERKLIEILDQSVYPYVERFTREDGQLIWGDKMVSRDGADDFYESFFNWPLFYLLGGGKHVLEIADREWDAITRQLTDLKMVSKEYEIGYDQFHQGESYIYFYFLCLADPTNPKLIDRARRFAGFYLNEDPEVPNYDPEHKIIRAPHNGSGGPRWGYFDNEPSYNWAAGMRRYGLPYQDVPGATTYDDLKDPVIARRMGEVMQERMGKGDVAANLPVTSLITNAYLMTGDEKYRNWVVEYVEAWKERADANNGFLPDNVGLSGKVGEYMDGKWYGGLYGWAWPHGLHNIEASALVAGANAYLMTQDQHYLDMARNQLDSAIKLGKIANLEEEESSLGKEKVGQLFAMGEKPETLLVPNRYNENGWFDYQVVSPEFPINIWYMSQADSDWARLEFLRENSTYDWRKVSSFRNKGDYGHEEPWLRFLAGDNPTYPEAILSATFGQVARRLELIRIDQEDLTKVYIHHWQQHNPVIVEALTQLTMGAPSVLYNGGLLHTLVRYYDVQQERAGLPQDVGALVSKIGPTSATIHLVNLNPFESREVVLQAGAFGEHQFKSASYASRTSDYPGGVYAYSAPPLETEQITVEIEDKYFQVELPPASEIVLELEMVRYVNTPSYKSLFN
ncbi:MAG: hypothetical protein J0I20_19985 [Chloroflexi bacterium]|nr:hypothetical protein [Chloroflexota bacterium]OJW06398.1 MAG: hypothetical protein BGO39_07905 [Chloroflexi bacterium 54-19]